MEGRDGEEYLGSVKVKVGPITAQFRGRAHYVDLDDGARTATIKASGKDPKGQATVNALISARLEPVSSHVSRVFVDTELDITGRMAQFGRGAIADVSNRLIGQFTENLGKELAGGQTSAGGVGPTAAPADSVAGSGDLNALGLIAPTLAKQAAPVLVGLVIGLLLGRALAQRG